MAWASKFNAGFVKPLIRQLLAIIQRDQRAALDWVGGTGVLPDIVSYQLAPLLIPQFPAVLVMPNETQFAQEAVGSLQSANRVFAVIAVTHQDGQAVVELLEDYTRALDAIFNTVPLSDFYTPLSLTLPILGGTATGPASPTPGAIQTTALNAGSVKELFVVSHLYNEIRQRRPGFACSATLELHIDREEV